MATKYFCDGCDNEIKNFKKDKHRVEVRIGPAEAALKEIDTTCELCDFCGSSLIERANPRRWPREAKAA